MHLLFFTIWLMFSWAIQIIMEPQLSRQTQDCTSECLSLQEPSSLWSGSALCLTSQSEEGVWGSTHWAPAERSGIHRWSSPSSSSSPSSPSHSQKRSHTCLTPEWEKRERIWFELLWQMSSELLYLRTNPPSWLDGFTLPSFSTGTLLLKLLWARWKVLYLLRTRGKCEEGSKDIGPRGKTAHELFFSYSLQAQHEEHCGHIFVFCLVENLINKNIR